MVGEVSEAAVPRPPSFPVEHCKSCNGLIIWATTANLRTMPVDAEPVNPNTGGGNILLAETGATPRATVVSNPARLFGKTVYRSHFVTCPHAERHRHPRARPSKRARS